MCVLSFDEIEKLLYVWVCVCGKECIGCCVLYYYVVFYEYYVIGDVLCEVYFVCDVV